MQYTKRLTSIVLAMLLAVSLFLLPACTKPEPPAFQTKSLTWPVSVPLPKAEDFAETIPEGYTVSLAEKYSVSSLGTYSIPLLLTDEKGREFTYTASLTLVNDTTPPTVSGTKDLIAYLGSGVSYLSGVNATDNCDAGVTLSVDTSAVNLKAVGFYNVIYRATDAAGNVTEIVRTLSVYEEEITEQMLYDLIDPILDSILWGGMTATEQLREIYDYVHANISYVSTSDKSSWVRAAYNGLMSRTGDCFTYFAISKAMMERIGIQSMDIERLPEVAAMVNERHYWSLVNLGSDVNPKWYHFDSCPIKGAPYMWGFLMTDAQLMQYSDMRENQNGISGYFYAYNSAAYPKTATTVITPISHS